MVPQKLTAAYLEQNRGPGYQVVVWFLCSLSTIVVVLRLLSRKVSNLRFGWDDVFIISAAIFSWASASSMFWGVSIGLGKHLEALDFQDKGSLYHNSLLFQLMYYCCLLFTKISILAFYRRVFPIGELRMTTYILTGLMIAWWITIVLVSILNCTDVKYNWDRTQRNGLCMNALGFVLGNSIPNIATDVAILLLPLPVIWKLQLPVKRKMAVTAIFSLGIFVVTASGIRVKFLAESNHDYSWSAAPVYLWTNIEPDIGIICACLPAMMPLVRLVSKKFGSKNLLPPAFSNAHSLSKMKWPRGRASEHILYTDQDRFTNLGDPIAPSTNTSWVSMESPPENEAAKRLEENWPLRRVHIRTDVNVVYDHV